MRYFDCILVETQKEYDELMNIYDGFGWLWKSKEIASYHNYWFKYKEFTVVDFFNHFGYGYIDKCSKHITFKNYVRQNKLKKLL